MRHKFHFCYLCSDWLEDGLRVYEVESTTHTRRKFRQVARETCGESMEPPADNLILFGEISGNRGQFITQLLFFSNDNIFHLKGRILWALIYSKLHEKNHVITY